MKISGIIKKVLTIIIFLTLLCVGSCFVFVEKDIFAEYTLQNDPTTTVTINGVVEYDRLGLGRSIFYGEIMLNGKTIESFSREHALYLFAPSVTNPNVKGETILSKRFGNNIIGLFGVDYVAVDFYSDGSITLGYTFDYTPYTLTLIPLENQ